MDKDEEILFDDLEEEMVSLPVDDEVFEYIEEQPEEDVPSHSNGGRLVNSAKNAYNHQKEHNNNLNSSKKNINSNSSNFKSKQDFQKNNKGTIDKLNDVKNKGQGLNKANAAGQAGKQVGNKLAGKSEEEKGNLEKATDDIGGKAASTAITAATGGAVSGPVADFLGNAAYQLGKKELERKKKKIKIMIIGSIIGITLFVMLFCSLFFNEDDESNTSVVTNQFVVGNMGVIELLEYLSYIKVCPSVSSIQETFEGSSNLLESIVNSGEIIQSCRNAIQYYINLKFTYEMSKQDCRVAGIPIPNFYNASALSENFRIQDKTLAFFNTQNYCQVTLPTQLLMETMSYGLTDRELFHGEYLLRYIDYSNDIKRLTTALTEYVHESCYIMVKRYKTKDGKIVENNCDGCTYLDEIKRNQNGYYFQISFNKFVSYLKYGDSSTHPNYSGLPLEKGKDYDHVCIGPENDVLEQEYEYLPGVDETNSEATSLVKCTGKLATLFHNKCPSNALEMAPYLVTIKVPVVDINGKRSTKSITVHKDLANDLEDIFTQIANAKFPIKDLGCYNWRETASGGISHHSFGVACDINSNENYMIKNSKIIAGSYWKPGDDPYSITTNGTVVRAFKNKGWIWGGNWNSSKDYMHFSYTGG